MPMQSSKSPTHTLQYSPRDIRDRCQDVCADMAFFETAFLDVYCSTVKGLLDWFEVDLRFTQLFVICADTGFFETA